MQPVRIHTSYHPIQARLIESRLKEAGIPFKMQLGSTGTPALQPGGPFEFWVEDEATANDPDLKAILQSVTRSGPFSQEEEDDIAEMELKDEPNEVGYATYLVVFVLGIAALWLVVQFLVWVLETMRGG